MKNRIKLFTIMVFATLVFAQCAEEDGESCVQDEICSQDVTSCCEDDDCYFEDEDGNQYATENEANSALCGTSVALSKLVDLRARAFAGQRN